MKGIIKIVCLFILLGSIKTQAQSYLEFVENKGQWTSDIKFKGLMTNGAFALQPSGYRIVLNNPEDTKAVSEFYHGHKDAVAGKSSPGKTTAPLTVHSHAYQVKFLGANENALVVPEKPANTYNNYFIGNDHSKWASNCKIYQAITYKNVYPNIDVRYYTDNGHLKYDIIVNPGGDANKIALYFDGAEGLKSKNGDLIVKTSVGDIKELAPYSYQLTKTTKKDIGCSYDIKGNIVRFKTEGPTDPSATLVIDPTLIFSTFTGSTSDNWGYTATYDASGNFYAGGIVFGTGFPVSNGAFQTTFQGGGSTGEGSPFDIGIMKFNSTGTNRVYATYIGGAGGNEQPHSLVVDNANNLIISGRTTSSDYPTTQPTFGSGGAWDIILTKLNATGTALISSRKFGGTGDDGVNIRSKYLTPTGDESIRRYYGDDARSEVIVDAGGNIYLASCTQSTNFPTTAGAAQTTPGNVASGRYQDGVVIKTTADLSTVLFSSLIGGTGDDAAFVLALNPTDNNIYVAGGTTSTNMPGNFTGSIFPTYQGGVTDGFIQVLTNDGSSFVKSTYIGTGGTDIVYGIQFDKFSYPYVMGTTTGNWPILNATFQQTGGKQFVSKLKKDLSGWEYSTVFGSNSTEPNISPTAFLVDRCENVYVSGWGGKGNTNQGYTSATTGGMSVTPDAYKATTDQSDFYFIVIERNAASQLYGSFFGQDNGSYPEHVDGGTSRFDKSGVIYQAICANCEGGAVFPTTPGAWAETNGAGNQGCNLAAIKIAFNLAGVGGSVQSSIHGVAGDTSGCVPLDVTFTDIIGEGKKFIWRFGDGSPDVSTTVPTITHTYNFVGLYNVMLISIDSSKCNISDTSYTTMRIRNDDAPLAFDAIKQQPCNALLYNFVNNSVAPAAKPFKANSFRWEFGDGTTLVSGSQTVSHTYTAPGTYNVRLILIDTNYCNEPDTALKTIRVAPLVKAQFETPPSGCAPYTALFNNTSLAGTDFTWDFGDGSPLSTQVNPTHLYSTVGTYTVTLVAVDTATCNKTDQTSFTIVISGKPTSAFTYLPQPPVANTYVTFTNNSIAGTNYKWDFGDGESLTTTTQNTVVRHLYNATQAYKACLIANNDYGCSDTTCQTVQARVIPALDVPNAFTPNNDGVNDIIYVNGFGIKQMIWRIYNRWGVLMFTSMSKEQGWDGKFKGVLQPQDVYSYGLEVEYTNGDKYSTTGDITLLR